MVVWWVRVGSNHRPSDYESPALTTELLAPKQQRYTVPVVTTAASPTATPLTITNVNLDGVGTAVRCADGLIADIGPAVIAQPGDDLLNGNAMAIMPGLVNAHTHAAMTLLRGYGDDLPLMEWLQTRIWPAEASLTPDDVYWGTRLAIIEMLRSGTTHFVDMYWHAPAVARAVADAGIRATVSSVFIDGCNAADGTAQRPRVLDELDQIAAAGALVQPAVGPHAVYTVSRPSLAWLAEVANERQIPVHIHLSETENEVTDCVKAHNMRPPALLDAVGMLGPRTLCAHGNWLTHDELDLLADRGTTVATCPVSNMKLASGRTFDIVEGRRRGVHMGLGTDGAASNNSLDLLGDVKVLALMHKHLAGDTAVLPAGEALAIASGAASPLLAGHTMAPGDPADMILVRLDTPEMTPSPLPEALVYAASGSMVDTAVVAGRVVMTNREVPGTDEVLAEVRTRSDRLRGH
jgi:5-methylthioadenosine/S-adenosylhomocysteine deaminase